MNDTEILNLIDKIILNYVKFYDDNEFFLRVGYNKEDYPFNYAPIMISTDVESSLNIEIDGCSLEENGELTIKEFKFYCIERFHENL